ncbi:TPA: tRNA-specific adenosine deaminase [Patescibacteria group bacterium]|nr:tRNA-specific adenosine deaminase [Patescibacteria group bacterium]
MIEARKEFMLAAIDEAIKARGLGDYAIGAVVVRGDQMLSRATNRSKQLTDATLHAEIVAIRDASKKLGSRYLDGCILYATHEPCPMCAAAAVWAKMAGIVSGAKMEDMADYRSVKGNETWQWRTIAISAREVLAKGDPKLEIIEEFMRDECRNLFHS